MDAHIYSRVRIHWKSAFQFENVFKRCSRTPEKDGMLDPSAAGHVATGETYEQAAIREMEEEIGVRAPVVFFGDSFRLS
jgi:isopentenyldiphosphate isomerase